MDKWENFGKKQNCHAGTSFSYMGCLVNICLQHDYEKHSDVTGCTKNHTFVLEKQPEFSTELNHFFSNWGKLFFGHPVQYTAW